MMDDKHDALVRFAAEKVGISVHPHEGMYGGFYARVEGFVTESRICKTEIEALKDFIDLTSPDLFFKGLAAMPDHLSWDIDGDGSEQYVLICDVSKCDTNYVKRWDKPSEIPQKFWECWAEAEGVELK